ncbi:MAG: hypothetical protein JSU89_10065, partial [Myxococcales bacterium]
GANETSGLRASNEAPALSYFGKTTHHSGSKERLYGEVLQQIARLATSPYASQGIVDFSTAPEGSALSG